MPVKPPQTPLAVLVVGGPDAQERYRQALETGLPGISLRARAASGRNSTDIENISAASAESHFAIADGTDPSLENLHGLFDALIITEDDLKNFLARADDFEQRRRTHQLPPDAAGATAHERMRSSSASTWPPPDESAPFPKGTGRR